MLKLFISRRGEIWSSVCETGLKLFIIYNINNYLDIMKIDIDERGEIWSYWLRLWKKRVAFKIFKIWYETYHKIFLTIAPVFMN
jgi:hypothetical protein